MCDLTSLVLRTRQIRGSGRRGVVEGREMPEKTYSAVTALRPDEVAMKVSAR